MTTWLSCRAVGKLGSWESLGDAATEGCASGGYYLRTEYGVEGSTPYSVVVTRMDSGVSSVPGLGRTLAMFDQL
jgi:hypothetical protein